MKFDGDEEYLDKHIYIHVKTGKVLTTSSLNKELNKFYGLYSKHVLELTGLGLKLRELKTNAMEIAWGRDLVKKYGYSKKAFIELSKYMGHRTVGDTISLLELQPIEGIKFSFDLFDPELDDEIKLESRLTNREEMTRYLFNRKIAYITKEHIRLNEKEYNYDMRTDSPEAWEELKNELGLDDEDFDNVKKLLD